MNSLPSPSSATMPMTRSLPRLALVLLPWLTANLLAQTEWVRWQGSLEPRTGYAMAYDPIRDRVVLFGGEGEPSNRGDTWEWDGVDWRRMSPTHGPTPRTGAGMAFDPVNREVLMFGGWVLLTSGFPYPTFTPVNETWSWNGTRWRQLLPPQNPPMRGAHAMALDTTRGRIVLYGGSQSHTFGYPPFAPPETWEWDGLSWSVTTTGPQPPPGSQSAMAFDRRRGRVVMFGGRDTNGLVDTVWEWDGALWTNPAPGVRPAGRVGAGLGYDATAGAVILVGGGFEGVDWMAGFDDTWSWDGVVWTQLQPNTRALGAGFARLVDRGNRSPFLHGAVTSWTWSGSSWVSQWLADAPPGSYFDEGSMAYDSSQRTGVLFRSGSTNLWRADRWQRATPVTSPSGRAGEAAAYDGSEVILFGGDESSALSAPTTWGWTGTDWHVRATTGPSPRFMHAMAYDEARRRVVLFGGSPSHSPWAAIGDTWEWDGSTWTQRAFASGPPARNRHAMAFDRATQRLVMFGGADANGAELGDFWTYDGASWIQLRPARSPSPRWGHTLTYDEHRRRVIMCGGGTDNRYLGIVEETWEWDGTTWWLRATATALSNRLFHAAIYEPEARATIVFGGRGQGVWGLGLGDTWLYRPIVSARYDAFGTACASSAGVPTLGARAPTLPWLGETLILDLAGLPPGSPAALISGASRARWGSTPLPLPLDVFGMTGCQLLASIDILTAMTAANAAGVATASIAIPYAPSLLGMELYQQAIAIDPPANPAGAVLSNGATLRIGGL